MRKAFTLIEMMVVVAIIGLVLTMGVSNISAGKRAARVKGAARDVHAAVRHARSVALVTGQRVVVNFSNVTVDDEVMAKVEVVSAKIISSDADRPEPQPYYVMDYKELPQKPKAKAGEKYELVHIRKAGEEEGEKAEPSGGGETIEEYLFSPMSEEAVSGMRILVKKGDDELSDETDVQTRSRISVFSNVDYLQSRYKEARAEAAKKEGEGRTGGEGSASPAGGGVNDMDGEVSVVWETNGAVEPHRIWIYPDGGKPEDGLLLDVDRFGAIKVLNGDGKEDD